MSKELPFNTKISVFKSLFEVKNVPFDLTITDVYSRIKKGNDILISKIDKIRNSTNKEEVAENKRSLVAIMFNGTFLERNDNSIKEHSGCCILDFDNYPDCETFQSERKRLIEDPYTLMLFKSPGGNGLKVLIRIPKSNKDDHKRRFKAYQEYIKSDYFDEKNCNLSRVCFESYDPDIYLNQECEQFNLIEPEIGYHISERPVLVPIEREDEIVNRLMVWWDAKFGFVEGSRNNNLYVLAQNFNEYGVSYDYGFNFVQNNVIIGKFSDAELRSLFDSAYKSTTAGTKFFEDKKKEQAVRQKIRNGIPASEIKKQTGLSETIINELKNTNNNIEPFWIVKTDKKGVETVSIEPYKYAQFLMKNGFKKYYPEQSKQPSFVFIKENKVNLSSAVEIKDMVLDYLIKNELINVWNYCSKSSMLFNENHLNMLDSISLEMIQDTKNTAFIPFLNGIAKVTKNNVEFMEYIDAEGYIWENQIIPRVFVSTKDFKNDFQDLISKVSNADTDRVNGLERTLGYLIHSHKDKANQTAIIVNDQEINDNPNGGSGKSLMITALSHFKRAVKIDGKTFDPKKSDFTYQRVNLDTQILAFDDVKKNFDFETLFSLITEGITVNRKNKDEVFIPFDRSPKIIITTNYVINGAGTSHDRRRHEIEFYQYFNSKVTPLTEYGRLLFDSWTSDDWMKFDNYMISNLQNFLSNGLTTTVSINGDAKRFIQSTSKDFYDWCEDGNLPTGIRVYNTEIIDRFLREFASYKHMHNRTFIKWVTEYAEFKDINIIKERDHVGRYFLLNGEIRDDVPF